MDERARPYPRAAEGADGEHAADEEGIPHLQQDGAGGAPIPYDIHQVQRPEQRRRYDDRQKAPLSARARFAEHEGKDDAAERRLFKQGDARAFQSEGGDRPRRARYPRRALREGDDGQVVHRDRERGQSKQQRFAARRRPHAADAHVKGKHEQYRAGYEAHDAQPQRLRDLFVLREQAAQPLRGQKRQPRREQI